MKVYEHWNPLRIIVSSRLVEIHLDIPSLIPRRNIDSLAYDPVLERLSTSDVKADPLDGAQKRSKASEERSEVYVPQTEGVAGGRRHNGCLDQRTTAVTYSRPSNVEAALDRLADEKSERDLLVNSRPARDCCGTEEEGKDARVGFGAWGR